MNLSHKTSHLSPPALEDKKGQVLPFGLLIMIVMMMLFFTVANVAKLLSEKMMLQNAADNAALSAAIVRARVLNRIGYLVNQLPSATAKSEIASLISGYNAAVNAAVDVVTKKQDMIGGLWGSPGGAESYTLINPPLGLTQEPVEGYVYHSWAGNDISNHKIYVTVSKTPSHPTMANFPYGKGFLNLATWQTMTIKARAAAACYNVKGPMFPPGVVANLDAAQDFYCKDTNTTPGDCNPAPGSHAHKWLVNDAPDNLDAHDGGWEAQLVPW